jgi:hypothetical protein
LEEVPAEEPRRLNRKQRRYLAKLQSGRA